MIDAADMNIGMPNITPQQEISPSSGKRVLINTREKGTSKRRRKDAQQEIVTPSPITSSPIPNPFPTIPIPQQQDLFTYMQICLSQAIFQASRGRL